MIKRTSLRLPVIWLKCTVNISFSLAPACLNKKHKILRESLGVWSLPPVCSHWELSENRFKSFLFCSMCYLLGPQVILREDEFPLVTCELNLDQLVQMLRSTKNANGQWEERLLVEQSLWCPPSFLSSTDHRVAGKLAGAGENSLALFSVYTVARKRVYKGGQLAFAVHWTSRSRSSVHSPWNLKCE